tara:strand:- start:858 stop:1199 length:342 start_codon:yes stop_codon:yes gene_type:complete
MTYRTIASNGNLQTFDNAPDAIANAKARIANGVRKVEVRSNVTGKLVFVKQSREVADFKIGVQSMAPRSRVTDGIRKGSVTSLTQTSETLIVGVIWDDGTVTAENVWHLGLVA